MTADKLHIIDHFTPDTRLYRRKSIWEYGELTTKILLFSRWVIQITRWDGRKTESQKGVSE